MPFYNYRAVGEDTSIIKGRIEASDEAELEERLRLRGLTLIEATKERLTVLFKRRQKLKDNELLNFTYFLHLILTSGIPIISGLRDMAKQLGNRRVSSLAGFVHAKVEAGMSLSEAMSEYPDSFPSYYTGMVKAGEASGKLDDVLSDLRNYLEWQIAFKKTIRSAMAYPAIVLTAVILLGTLLFTFVMPKFVRILTELKVPLPMPTKVLIFIASFIKGYWPVIILFLVSIPLIFRFVYKTESGKRMIDLLMLKLPIFGGLIRRLNLSRYFRTFATLYRSGLTIDDTLKISTDVIKNTIIITSLRRVTEVVLGGESLYRAFRDVEGFPPIVINMVEIGEKTGTLDTTALRISEMYDREVSETLRRLFTILEPLIIIMLGALVLLTLASFFLPLYRIVGGIPR
jgi:type II secretory pathway component PulF